jgi:hypothetical protein
VEFATANVEDEDYAEKLDEYKAKLAGLLRGTKNLRVSGVARLHFCSFTQYCFIELRQRGQYDSQYCCQFVASVWSRPFSNAGAGLYFAGDSPWANLW